jgi:hypothetical protein
VPYGPNGKNGVVGDGPLLQAVEYDVGTVKDPLRLKGIVYQ